MNAVENRKWETEQRKADRWKDERRRKPENLKMNEGEQRKMKN